MKEATKASIADDVLHLRLLDPFIGDLPLEAVHMGTLQTFIEHRKRQGEKKRKGFKRPPGVKNRNHKLCFAGSQAYPQLGGQ